MSRYNEETTQRSLMRIFQPEPMGTTEIINPNNRLKTTVPECDGTDGALFFALDKLFLSTAIVALLW